nr:hypothetical protein [Rhodococcus sp. 06-621-2]
MVARRHPGSDAVDLEHERRIAGLYVPGLEEAVDVVEMDLS